MSKAGQLIGCEKRRKPLLLFVLQKGRCAICGRPMDKIRGTAQNPSGWTVEHVVPRADGGGRESNLVLTHSACNNKKGGDMPLTYLRRMAADLDAVCAFLEQHKAALNTRQKTILFGG